MTAQMATRLTLRSFKHKKRKVSIISPDTLVCIRPDHKQQQKQTLAFLANLRVHVQYYIESPLPGCVDTCRRQNYGRIYPSCSAHHFGYTLQDTLKL